MKKREIHAGILIVACLLTPLLAMLTPATGYAASGSAASARAASSVSSTRAHTTRQVVAYFTQWGIYSRNYLVKNVDTSGTASKLTTLNYAFANVDSSLQCASVDPWADYQKTFTADQAVNGVADTWDQPLAGNFNQLKELKAKYPKLKILISIGGWTLSTNFSAAAQPQNVAAFVRSCIDQYILGNQGGAGKLANIFDGFDIDWEYPDNPGNGNPFGPQDTPNYTNLLKTFRTQLDQVGTTTGKHYLLTAATPAGQTKYQHIQLGQIGNYIDWANVMTYDYHGPWDANGPTDFNAPLVASPRDPSPPPSNSQSVTQTINAYLAAGMPARKIVLGLPIYGHGWTNVPDQNNGLYQSSPAIQPAPSSNAAGTEDYRILENMNGYTGHRDPVTLSYWIFNGTTFWSYDDIPTVYIKDTYIRLKGLGGAFAWSLDGDDASGSFMNAVYTGLR